MARINVTVKYIPQVCGGLGGSWQPRSTDVVTIEGQDYVKLNCADRGFARYLGWSEPLGRSVGLKCLISLRNDAVTRMQIADECPLFQDVVSARPNKIAKTMNEKKKLWTSADRRELVQITVPEFEYEGEHVLPITFKVAVPVDCRDCLFVPLKDTTLNILHKFITASGTTDETKYVRANEELPKGCIHNRKRNGYVLRWEDATGTHTRSFRVPNGDADDDACERCVVVDQIKAFIENGYEDETVAEPADDDAAIDADAGAAQCDMAHAAAGG